MLIVICLLGALLSTAIAVSKNRNPIGWFVGGALLPLISVVILLALPSEPVEGGKPAA